MSARTMPQGYRHVILVLLYTKTKTKRDMKTEDVSVITRKE
jgi:hypothetical protein